ncbi:PucR family transcriptional regulator [Nocardioides alpinus]|uniref:PucR family transcriptional regulator n=1 Tax=Nocardioides alpinus TaxID=748909 RepID=UPI00158746E5|nr:helix-turn-helix domain-containing protein [Nocardioides alpinus]
MADRIDPSGAAVDAYFLRNQDQKRRVVVSDILRGVPADVDQLGYSLNSAHLAVVAWGRSPEANIRALAASFDAGQLVVSGTSGSFVGWLGSSALKSALERQSHAVEAMPGTHLALGEVEHGVEGFRLSYRQARQAYRVGRLVATQVVHYGDVALESLMLKDRQEVQDFVSRELGPLRDEGSSRDELLKSTLRAYFRAGLNAATTAQAIDVHERTVAYRLRSIESRLGVSVAARRDELAAALRLADLLDRSPGDDRRDFSYKDVGLGPDPEIGMP